MLINLNGVQHPSEPISVKQSIPDFISKLQISLKETYETEFWLEVVGKAEILPFEDVKKLLHDCGVIRRMLIASVNTAKEKI